MRPRRIIIIGAARSGTKILRDSLAASTGVGAVPYDINFVWRYRNESSPDDILAPEWSSSLSQRFIASYIDRYAYNEAVLEKTVSNTLRVPFVRETFPDAVFVHLIRDGVDAIESSRSQWLSPADRSYVLSKARHFPLRLLPGYGRKYVTRILRHRSGRGRPIGSWGVRYPGIDDDLSRSGLLTVCARQWRYSVERATAAFGSLDNHVINIRYEDLVASPHDVLQRTADELDLPTTPAALHTVASTITSTTVGKGARRLTDDELATIGAEVDQTLEQSGYRRASAHRES